MTTVHGTSGNDTIKIDGYGDVAYGGAGNDKIWLSDVGTGYGGLGDDTYYITAISNQWQLIENADEGTDTIWALDEIKQDKDSYSFTIPDNIENFRASLSYSDWTYSTAVTGNSLDNFIQGDDDSADTFKGGDGDDTLWGYNRDDILFGEGGNDVLDGGKGDDTLFGGSGQDVLLAGKPDNGEVDKLWGDADGDFFLLTGADEGADSLSGTTFGFEHFMAYWGSAIIPSLAFSAGFSATGYSGLAGTLVSSLITNGVNYAAVIGYQLNNQTVIEADKDDVIEIMDFDPREDVIAIQLSDAMTLTPSYDETGGVLEITKDGDTLAIIHLSDDVVALLEEQGFTKNSLFNDVLEHSLGRYDGDSLTAEMLANWGLTTTQSDILGGEYDSDTNLLLFGAWLPLQTAPDSSDITWGTNNDDVLRAETASFYEDIDTHGQSNDGNSNDKSYLYGWGGNDLIAGTAGIDHLFGGDGDDTLWGYGNPYDGVSESRDRLEGGNGNDVLYGGTGADLMQGDAGDDSYFVDDADDIVEENAAEGLDTIYSDIDFTLADNVEILYLYTSEDTFDIATAIIGTGNSSDNIIYGNANANIFYGGGGADTFWGEEGDDVYYVDSADDSPREANLKGIDTVYSSISWSLGGTYIENLTLTGTDAIDGSGNSLDNVITGNSADNVLNGSKGNDSYYVQNIGDSVIEAANQGTDTVYSSIDWVLGENIENLTLTGSDSIKGTGNSLNNVITGNSGDNWLLGGAGNDSYYVSSADDVVTEYANEGTDTVYSSITWVLGNNFENLVLTGDHVIEGTGNSLDNVITGNSTTNRLHGGDGNDSLFGAGGWDYLYAGGDDDVLDGGSDGDSMYGDAGDDDYYVDNSSDKTIEDAGGGTDTVYSSIDWQIGDNIENLVLIGSAIKGTGNSLDNHITGNSGNNILDGGTGADTLYGGQGDDTYNVDDEGDTVVEAQNEGTDLIVSSVTYSLSDHEDGAQYVENLTLSGTSGINGTGNSLANKITGNSGSNKLYGGAGNDTLDGGIGGDTLVGGTGDDNYYVDNFNDTITENSGEGTDQVWSSVNIALGSNIENIQLLGTAGLWVIGNGLANTITGNSGANVLEGGSGNDTLVGGEGNDAVLGQSGNDTIYGGSGSDTLVGGTDDDDYYVDDSGDTISENSGEGTDEIWSAVSFTLSNNVENLTLTGTNAIIGTGNELANTITGNSAANTLNGGNGNDYLDGDGGYDVLYGGIGNDTLKDSGGGDDHMEGGDGNDIFYVNSSGDKVVEWVNGGNGGTDLVYSSISYVLTSNVENLTLIGTNSIQGAGNELGNTISGNSATNILHGKSGSDVLYGNDGNDYLFGQDNFISDTSTDADTLYGGNGNDYLDGDGGNDVLYGGAGDDRLVGGGGTDKFYFDGGKDIITDFASGEKIYVKLQGIDLSSEVKVSGDVYTFTGYDTSTTSLTITGVDPTAIYYDTSVSALVMAA